MGFGLGLKLRSRSQGTKKGAEYDEEWYIPYTGSYEPPREPPRRPRARDSWGDPVDGDDEADGAILGDAELHQRFGDYGEISSHGTLKSGDSDQKGTRRDRSFSLVSGRTVSSGAVDPNRGSIVPPRRSTVSSTHRPAAPPYINLDGTGGVGESPAPHIHAKEAHLSGRLSLASIFTFSSPGPKTPSSSAFSPVRSRKSSLRKPTQGQEKHSGPEKKSLGRVPAPLCQSSSSSESQRSSPEKAPLILQRASDAAITDQSDYYNSYYSTLLKAPAHETMTMSMDSHHGGVKSEAADQLSRNSSPSQPESASSKSLHPYAYAFPETDVQSIPARDIAASTNKVAQLHRRPSRLMFARSKGATGTSASRPDGLGLKQIKNSTSTPNLRSPSPYVLPKGLDRWLSAETWCDAILFPRPRLKVTEARNVTRRIVSPPASPLEVTDGSRNVPAFTSRVLAHSRSLVNLHGDTPNDTGKQPANGADVLPSASLRPPRPKSFAADDLALINPVFSLERVLEEGEELENQRKQWQDQATASIGNAQARILARSRSKSLTQKGRRNDHHHQTSFDYLAARACLGNQNLLPEIQAPRTRTPSSTGTRSVSTSGRASHSHSGSLARTMTKSSKSHSRGHSHSESWGKGAQRDGKVSETGVWVGGDHRKTPSSEGALKRDDIKVTRNASPALLSTDHSYPSQHNGGTPRVSPTPSGGSNIQMGIAISTTPLPDDSLDRESIRMPAHPYAQAGLHTRKNYVGSNDSRQERSSNYVGPHSPPLEFPDVSYSQRPSPPIFSHPYAKAASQEDGDDDDLIAQPRSGSTVPAPAKMWAQLSPGVVREVLPGDIKYSPFLPDVDADEVEYDTVGLGEALTYSSQRDSRDSGLGTSESHMIQPYRTRSPRDLQELDFEQQSELGQRQVHRRPVQYDASRPIYAQHHYRLTDSPTDGVSLPLSNMELLPIPEVDGASHSPAPTSGTPSPDPSPRSLGSPNDLDNFRDLFYQSSTTRPSTIAVEDHPTSLPSRSGSLTWEFANRSRRTGSGLTSLARQLSEEFEQLEQDRASSQYSYSSGSFSQQHLRKPTQGNLQFVFEQATRSASPVDLENDPDSTVVFRPDFLVPEDVGSSAASSMVDVDRTIEGDEDDTAMLRVGMVEPVSTPPTETADCRRSFTGLMSDDIQLNAEPASADAIRSRFSGLQPPTEATRSSYMTTSTTSRISGLSDFPVPPKDGGHMSLLTSYFDETVNYHELQALRETPHPHSPHDRRFTFGINQDATVAGTVPEP